MLVRVISYIGLVVLVIGLVWGGFVVNRWFNFNFGYATHVRAEICKMVKSEYLRVKCK